MASGHANRTKRPNTWPHRPTCDVKKVLANSEPSTRAAKVCATSCPQLLEEADIRAKTVTSVHDPKRRLAGPKSRSAASP